MVFQFLTSSQKRKLKRLHHRNVPPVLLQIVALCFLAGLADQAGISHYDMAEFFAGERAVTQAFCTRGLRGVAYELKQDDICEDILSRSGFAYAVALVLSLDPGAIVWFPTICNHHTIKLLLSTGLCCV